MEVFLDFQHKAEQDLKIAKYLMKVTFSLVQDPKMLLGVLERIFLAMNHSLSCIVHYERLFKRIPPFHNTFESKYMSYKHRVMPRYKIKKEYSETLDSITAILIAHKKAPVEFSRPGMFVICDDDYKMEKITSEKIRKYIEIASEFHASVSEITGKHKKLFKTTEDLSGSSIIKRRT